MSKVLHKIAGATHKGVKLALLRLDIDGATIAMSAVTKTGTGTAPDLVLSGAPDGAAGVGPAMIGNVMRFEITKRGARGTAEFRWTRNYTGSASTTEWDESGVVTSASDALGDTGVTAEWGTGTDYELDNVFTATALGPSAVSTSVDGYIGDRDKPDYVQGWRRTDVGVWTFYGKLGGGTVHPPNIHPTAKPGGSSPTLDPKANVLTNNWTSNPPNFSLQLIDTSAGTALDPDTDNDPSIYVEMWMPDSGGNV